MSKRTVLRRGVRKSTPFGATESGKDSECVCPGQVQPNHHHRREGKQLSDAARESLITVLKVVTDADDNMVRILVTIG